jgi:hypothetical protein
VDVANIKSILPGDLKPIREAVSESEEDSYGFERKIDMLNVHDLEGEF